MRAGVVAGHDLVERIDRAEVEIGLPAPVAPDLVHVAVERLEDELHPVEERVERRLIAGEVRADELLERRRVAVLGAPELGDLLRCRAAMRGALRLAVLRDELRFEFCIESFIRACRGLARQLRRVVRTISGECERGNIGAGSYRPPTRPVRTLSTQRCRFVRCVGSAVQGSSGHGCFG